MTARDEMDRIARILGLTALCRRVGHYPFARYAARNGVPLDDALTAVRMCTLRYGHAN